VRAKVMLRMVFTPETRAGGRSLRFDALGAGRLDLFPDRDTLRSHGQDGTWRGANHLLRHRSEHQPIEAGATMSSDDHEIGTDVRSQLDDRFGRCSHPDVPRYAGNAARRGAQQFIELIASAILVSDEPELRGSDHFSRSQ